MDAKTALEGWKEEAGSAYLYHFIAESEKETPRAILFKHLGDSARNQALHWEKTLKQMGIEVPSSYTPTFRIKLVSWLIMLLGPKALKPILAAMKVRGLSVYLGEMAGQATVKKKSVSKIHEDRHGAIRNGVIIRASVFGVNDGLISNASLILGIAGASSSTNLIILSGIAGLCAGAFSMAAGEYISMRSQRELFEYQIALERAELEEYPEEEAAELSYIYQARGLEKADADLLAQKVLLDKENALNTLAREELGLNPDDLGSPWSAAISSLLSFALGGFIPVVPFLFDFGKNSLTISIFLTGAFLFAVGSVLSLFTGRNAVFSGLRMLAIGALAGGVTFLIGHWVGVNLN